MKNILKRFEEGGEEDKSVKLESADKKDTPEGSVKKYTQGFLGAIKNKATTAETEKLYKLAKQSGDPKLMQILGENPEQGQGQPMQPQQPMAKYGMQKYQDKGEVTQYTWVNPPEKDPDEKNTNWYVHVPEDEKDLTPLEREIKAFILIHTYLNN